MKLCLVFAIGLSVALAPHLSAQGSIDNPILYVTQVPVTATTDTVVSIGGSHLSGTSAAPRGGDLMIHYRDGSSKNLTREAGYGVPDQLQGRDSIAVRDPSVHWDGNRAVFSMVVGGPQSIRDTTKFFWQIYEVVGLRKNDIPVITKVPGQSASFNNIQPTYASGKIIFVSDQSIGGAARQYSVLNEQGGKSVTGLWSIELNTNKLSLMDHSPSGSFKPFVDSFGRVVFSRWDHLQRDVDASLKNAIDYSSEASDATSTSDWKDIFPEALNNDGTSLAHRFDLFLPWTMNQDGTGLLTMNHLGRHELSPRVNRARTDSNLINFAPEQPPLAPPGAPTRAGSYLHLAEDPTVRGKYIATDAISSAVSAGRLVTFTSPPEQNADSVEVTSVNFEGLARDASQLQDRPGDRSSRGPTHRSTSAPWRQRREPPHQQPWQCQDRS